MIVDHTKSYLARAELAVEQAIAISTIKVQREARRLAHQAAFPPPSAPGSPPHVRTGTLVRSIDQETFRTGPLFVGRVGTNLEYGRFLEMGTRDMGARPYLRPALDAILPSLKAELRKAGGRMR